MKSLSKEHCKAYCARFGTTAVELQFITSEQLKWALDQQVEDDLAGRAHRVLGAICFAHGWMNPEQIDIVLNRMFKARVEQVNQAAEAEKAAV